MITVRAVLLSITAVLACSVGAVEVPVRDANQWTRLSYRNMPANTVSFADGQMRVAVEKSPSPLVQKRAAPVMVGGVMVRARWDGSLSLVIQPAVQFDVKVAQALFLLAPQRAVETHRARTFLYHRQ